MTKRPNFKGVEFAPLLKEAGSNAFTMSPTRWVELTNQQVSFAKLERMEALPHALFINDGMPQSERLIKLNQIAIQQMKILEDTGGRNLLQ